MSDRAPKIPPNLNLRFWPDWRGANPYQELFYSALTRFGVRAEPGLEFDLKWLRARREDIDAIHIHWPEGIWRRYGLHAVKEPLHLMRLRAYLRGARALGVKVVWTVHNLEDHEGANPMDAYAYRILLRNSDIVIVHSSAVADHRGGTTLWRAGDEKVWFGQWVYRELLEGSLALLGTIARRTAS